MPEQDKQKDHVLFLNFMENIQSKELENLSNDQVEVHYFDVKHSIPDLEQLIYGDEESNLPRFNKIIVKGHGSKFGERKTDTEQHIIYFDGARTPNKSKATNTEDFLKLLLKKFPDTEEIILNSCYAGGIRASNIPCTITAISGAKHGSLSDESQEYFLWRMHHYRQFEDPAVAFGAHSKLFPISSVLKYYDKNSGEAVTFKSIAPKDEEDIKNTEGFLSSKTIGVFTPANNDKSHQRHNIQLRHSDNGDLEHEILEKIMLGKKQIDLNEQAEYDFVRRAANNNISIGKTDRAIAYRKYFKQKYNTDFPIRIYPVFGHRDISIADRFQLAESLYKFDNDIEAQAILTPLQRLDICSYMVLNIRENNMCKRVIEEFQDILTNPAALAEYAAKIDKMLLSALRNSNINIQKCYKALADHTQNMDADVSNKYRERYRAIKNKQYSEIMTHYYQATLSRDPSIEVMAYLQLDASTMAQRCALEENLLPKDRLACAKIFTKYDPSNAGKCIDFFKKQNPRKAVNLFLNAGDSALLKGNKDLAPYYYNEALYLAGDRSIGVDPIKFSECQIKRLFCTEELQSFKKQYRDIIGSIDDDVATDSLYQNLAFFFTTVGEYELASECCPKQFLPESQPYDVAMALLWRAEFIASTNIERAKEYIDQVGNVIKNNFNQLKTFE